jgi:hypothetical protein
MRARDEHAQSYGEGQGDRMRLIARSEGPKRLTITPDRHGKPWFPRAVDNGETIGSDDVEYVRADIHRGAVDLLREMVEAYDANAWTDKRDHLTERQFMAYEAARHLTGRR